MRMLVDFLISAVVMVIIISIMVFVMDGGFGFYVYLAGMIKSMFLSLLSNGPAFIAIILLSALTVVLVTLIKLKEMEKKKEIYARGRYRRI